MTATIPQAFTLAVQHHQAGQLAEAEALYRQILAVEPNHAGARHFLGVIAHQTGHHEAAIEWIRQAIALDPNNADAYSNLGMAYQKLGRSQEAITSYRRALQLKPDYAAAHNNLGIALTSQGRFEEAVAAYRRAIALHPNYPEAYNNLGGALADEGRFDEAMTAYHRALELKPDYPQALNNLGNALYQQGQLADAVTAYRRSLALHASDPEAHNNLGVALERLGKVEEAGEAYRQALALKADYPEANNNLGIALKSMGRIDEAIVALRRALALKTDYVEAHNNLGNLLKDRGQIDEAVAAFRQALECKPDHAWTLSNLIYALHFHPGPEHETLIENQRRWNRQIGDPLKASILPHANDRGPGRRLRIGYVSPDFRDHVVGRNLVPLFRCHAREEFEIWCYSGVEQSDERTESFQRRADHWRSTVGVSDEAMAAMIRADRVDILVDLAQHMSSNRLPVFARCPAPVQVSFAGYPASTGLEAIGYRISDRWLEAGGVQIETQAGRERPPGVPHLPAAEQLCLIESFWCYDPCGMEVAVHELPVQEKGWITFGSLNNFSKVNDPLLKLWARVLAQVPASRLVLLSALGSHRQRTVEILEQDGITASRIDFIAPCPRRAYLELYHAVDIVLDPHPYNGHTTSLDALWMGVPFVSLAGERSVSRAGLSMLSNLGLPELVAHSEEEYVRIAVQLAGDLTRLAELRATLRARMEASVLMDAPRFTRSIEAAYRTMWQAWCASSVL